MFGDPSTGTTSRGAQFESALFQTLLNFHGCTHIRTAAYHPAANGMVERFHRQLYTVLRTKIDPGNWSDNLPLAILGIRAALKSDLGCSAAELVFGTTFRLLGEMVTPTSRGDNFVHHLPEDVVSVHRVMAAVAEESPDLPRGQYSADPLPPDPPPSLPHAPLPSKPSPTPLSSTSSDPNSSNSTGIRTTRSVR
ncbi:hypothetical protein SprV_0100342700 [Sparganum proliferum]